jgi:tRNA-2-methylthio-N6-dimethylallyladenosine synthase
MMKKVFIKTFGCQMNEYDSQKMLEVLAANEPVQATTEQSEADIILFNTCSVREKAQEKVFSDLGRARELKQARPDIVIGVGGCVASQEGDAIVRRAPYVDLVFGPQTLHRLPDLLNRRQVTGRSQVDISFPEIEKFDYLPAPKAEGVTAFVSIMEGCSKYCSFCVVPYTRGEEVSRPLQDVLSEIAQLAQSGVREITLLGQNVNAYLGVLDKVKVSEGQRADFSLLLELVSEIPGIERIRYTTSHPREFGQNLIEAHARLPKLTPYVHLPVQAGSDRILAAMKRGYTALEYKATIRKLRAAVPDLVLSSDFIVGFPGETEDDFEQTLKLVRDLDFDACYSFVYSRRPGTPAADLPDEVPESVKLARLKRLQAQIDHQAFAHAKACVGKTEWVLVEGPAKRSPHEWMGRTPGNRVVNFALPQSASEAWVGKLVPILITEARAHTLRGEFTGIP